MTDLIIETARPEDAEALLAIYAPYVTDTAITFEYSVPSVEEFRERICNTLKNYPYLVAKLSNEIVGYAYAHAFRERAAYAWDVETTIYVKQDTRGRGIGRELYSALEKELKLLNVINLYAGVAYPNEEDEYLTHASADFHEHVGYHQAGEFYKCGYKFNRWYNVRWMEKQLGEHNNEPGAIGCFETFESKYCRVEYVPKDNIVFLTWKTACSYEDYRKPAMHAAMLLKKYKNSNLIIDARNGFEDAPADIEWGLSCLIPTMAETTCKFVSFIMKEVIEDSLGVEMDVWTKAFEKYFTVTKAADYKNALSSQSSCMDRADLELSRKG